MKKLLFIFGLIISVFIINAQTWTPVYDTDAAEFKDLQFFDGNSGYVVGGITTTPYILKTTNGGSDWINKNTGIADGNVQAIAFQDISTGFVATSAGELYKTDNGADSWTQVIPEADYLIFGVTYAGNYSGNDVYYAYGVDKLFKTTNFGDTWTPVFSESFYIFYTACTANGNGLEFYNENEAFFVFNSDLEVYKFDESTAYSIYEFSNSGSQACIDVLSEDLLFASSGTRFTKITNPGDDYQVSNNLTAALYLSDFDFLDENMGFGVATTGKIYEIISGGYTVNEEYDSGEQLNSVYIADNQTVYAVGNDGQIFKRTGNITEISNVVENNSIIIYPTVSNGTINIKVNSDILNREYQIIDMSGKTVKSGNASVKKLLLNLPAGMYIFKIPEENINTKFIIK